MKSKNALILGFVAWVATTGCGIAEKRAKALLEQENYDEAATAFEKVVASDPENLEAKANLTKARQGVISKRLIDVRKLRQGGSPLGAADLLVATLVQAKAWGVRPPGQAVATEEEEIAFATKYLVGEFETQVKKLLPVATESLLNRYGSLFEERGKRALQQFTESARKQGSELCRKLDRDSFQKKPEYAKLVGRVCMHYSLKAQLPGYSEADLLARRWGSIDLAASVEGFDENQRRGLKVALDTALQEHPLFDAKGQKLAMKAHGRYRLNQQKIPVQLLHTYYVDEQYVTTEIVTKERVMPVQMPGGAIVNQTVSYQEEVPVTRTRRVARQFPYGGWRILIEGSLEGVASCVRVMRGGTTPTFVDDWYKAEFGLSRADFEKVIPL